MARHLRWIWLAGGVWAVSAAAADGIWKRILTALKVRELLISNNRRGDNANALSGILVITAASLASAADMVTAQGSESGTAEQQPSVVEDFSYPGAATILANDHVQLISGDAHIVYAPCPTGQDTVGVIQVKTTESVGSSLNGRVCSRSWAPAASCP
ncbi:hypothetical protein QRX60_15160 [Amycolatopsis mongoliensis]|uniref:Uncharacterized protein n=1 Tax=Amycolatopsis mongoliensis TaxID=715475 RepID=A0A9Y2K0P3_9PSEU|nr:hypothetical protein [Amycolatopsis sp. 4-36]WIY07673.1 hypothetical protein QRX60_15160 [Amycolatopsis sp. 4-36]